MSKVLVIDGSIAGISGDMLLGALIDLGANPKLLYDLKEAILKREPSVTRLDIKVYDVKRCEIRAKKVDVIAEDSKSHRHGKELLRIFHAIVDELNLDEKTRSIVFKAITTLLEAEAHVHGEEIEDVELHEIGRIDTVIDIIGSALLLKDLGLIDNVDTYALPIAVGGGRIKIEHGLVSAPPPAALEILHKGKFYVIGGPIEGELTTPTGAALLLALNAKPTLYYPLQQIEKVGYGAGSKDFTEVPNICRLILGSKTGVWGSEEVVIVETDVDDVSGEVLGYMIDKLLSEGAKDVYLIPRFGKKNRPGFIVRIITSPEKYFHFIDILIKELGTLGVRYLNILRHYVPLRTIENVSISINGKEYVVRIKVSRDYSGKVIAAKPEYEDVKNIALQTGISLTKIYHIIYKKLSELNMI